MLLLDDFARLEPMLERVPLTFQALLVTAHEPISHVYFPESGVVSTVADTEQERIEVGVIGREGMVGVPAVLGVDRTPHTSVVQGPGEAWRIAASDLRVAITAAPSIFRPFGLFTHTLMIQLAQTTYANVALTVEARLARWILMMRDRSDGDHLALTHEFLSVMLGVRRPGVTVAIHALEGMRAIRALRGQIVVRNRAMLEDIAGDAYHMAEREYERVMA